MKSVSAKRWRKAIITLTPCTGGERDLKNRDDSREVDIKIVLSLLTIGRHSINRCRLTVQHNQCRGDDILKDGGLTNKELLHEEPVYIN